MNGVFEHYTYGKRNSRKEKKSEQPFGISDHNLQCKDNSCENIIKLQNEMRRKQSKKTDSKLWNMNGSYQLQWCILPFPGRERGFKSSSTQLRIYMILNIPQFWPLNFIQHTQNSYHCIKHQHFRFYSIVFQVYCKKASVCYQYFIAPLCWFDHLFTYNSLFIDGFLIRHSCEIV